MHGCLRGEDVYVVVDSIEEFPRAGRPRVSTPDPGATRDYSRGNPASRAEIRIPDALRYGLLAAAVGGVVLLLVAEFSTIISLQVGVAGCPSGQPCPKSTGYKRHLFALGLVAIVALPLAWGAAIGASRPAMLALAGLGAVALVLILLRDATHLHDTGVIGRRYEDARASAETGFYLETLGAVLLLVSGGALALLTAGRSSVDRATADDDPVAERSA